MGQRAVNGREHGGENHSNSNWDPSWIDPLDLHHKEGQPQGFADISKGSFGSQGPGAPSKVISFVRSLSPTQGGYLTWRTFALDRRCALQCLSCHCRTLVQPQAAAMGSSAQLGPFLSLLFAVLLHKGSPPTLYNSILAPTDA